MRQSWTSHSTHYSQLFGRPNADYPETRPYAYLLSWDDDGSWTRFSSMHTVWVSRSPTFVEEP